MTEQTTEPQIDDHFDIRTHNGTITVENTRRGTHRTFRIKTQKNTAKFAPNERILSLLTSPNNYTQIGFVKPASDHHPNGRIILWARHRTEQIEALIRVLQYPDHFRTKGCKYHFEGQCIICNRPLTNPESIRSGIGPKCASR